MNRARSDGPRHHGAQRVGLLTDLGSLEQLAVQCLRQWDRTPATQLRLTAQLAMKLGAGRGRNTQSVLNDLMEVGARYGRRPLSRHHQLCDCLGADEAIFACLIDTAANGDQEDAALLAALIIRPDMASCFAGLAAEFGLALAAILRSNMPFDTGPTLHQAAVH